MWRLRSLCCVHGTWAKSLDKHVMWPSLWFEVINESCPSQFIHWNFNRTRSILKYWILAQNGQYETVDSMQACKPMKVVLSSFNPCGRDFYIKNAEAFHSGFERSQIIDNILNYYYRNWTLKKSWPPFFFTHKYFLQKMSCAAYVKVIHFNQPHKVEEEMSLSYSTVQQRVLFLFTVKLSYSMTCLWPNQMFFLIIF